MLPDKVKKIGPGSAAELVETKSLKASDKFELGGKVWTLLAVKPTGIECSQDPSFFAYTGP